MKLTTFDEFIYYATEANLNKDAIFVKATELFPLFDPSQTDTSNDKFIDDYILEMYAESRGLGMPVVEVAQSLGLSATLISRIYRGEKLSLERLISFCKAEAFAIANMKKKHLKKIADADGVGASVTFLEKAYSKLYGDKHQIDVNTGFIDDEKDEFVFTIHRVDNKIKESADQKALKERLLRSDCVDDD